MTKWSYKVTYIETHQLPNQLEFYGQQGWELITMKDNFFIFKRPTHSPNDE